MNFFVTTPPMLTPHGTPLLGSPCVTVTGTPLYSAYPTPMHTSACTSYCPSYCSEYSYDSNDEENNKLYDDNILCIDYEVHIVNATELLSNLYAEIRSIIEVVSDAETPLPIATLLQLLHNCNWDRQGLISDLNDESHRAEKLKDYAIHESELVITEEVCQECSKPHNGLHIGCQHSYCDCWKAHIASCCQSSAMGIRCPHKDCKRYLTREIVVHLAPEYAAEFDALTLNSFVLSHPHLLYCPNSGCDAILKVPPAEFQRVVNCSACSHRFCVLCGGDHEPATCEDVRVWTDLVAQDTALQAQIRLQSLQTLRDIEAHEIEMQRAQLQTHADSVFRVDTENTSHSPVAVYGYEVQSRYWRDLAVRQIPSHIAPSPVMWKDIVTDNKEKNCPGCATNLKSSGAVQRVCDACAHEFCWVCLGDWNSHTTAACPHLALTTEENRYRIALKLACYVDNSTSGSLLPTRVNVLYEKFASARATYDSLSQRLKELRRLVQDYAENDIAMSLWRLVEQCLTALMLSHIRLLFTSPYQQRKDLEYRQSCLSDAADAAVALLSSSSVDINEATSLMEPMRRYLNILTTEKSLNEDL